MAKACLDINGDGGFACIRLGHSCIHNHVTLISRLRLDAALYDFPDTPPKGQRGRHRVKGKKVTPLKQLADDNTQSWKKVIVDWYNGEKKTVNILTGVNLWYSSGEKPLPIR